MDAATAGVAGGAVGAVLGLGGGALRARWLSTRRGAARAGSGRNRSVVPVDHADAPGPRPGGERTHPDLPAGVIDVLTALRMGSVVLDDAERIRWASPTAYAWGLLRDGRLADDGAVQAVRTVRSTGQVRSFELEPRRRRGPRLVLAVRVARVGSDLVLVLADDRSEAARVDDVRRDFVANVSHELKTPVGALSLLAEAVEGAAEEPQAVLRFAGRMQHEAARLASMVNELIELSRLQGDSLGADPDVVPVDEVVADALDSVRTAAMAKHIDLRVAGEHALVIEGVRTQLTTALRNLLENAVNYSPERTRVVVSAHVVGDRVELGVTDQGIGISPVDQERVFERFYRVDPARSRATGGTGLGLSIVKHVCANHGGDVVLWSTEGAGSTFTLRLPVHAWAPPPGAQRAAAGQRDPELNGLPTPTSHGDQARDHPEPAVRAVPARAQPAGHALDPQPGTVLP